MNLKIYLKNPNLCEGCPMLRFVSDEGIGNIWTCEYYHKLLNIEMIFDPILRPLDCIEENGL